MIVLLVSRTDKAQVQRTSEKTRTHKRGAHDGRSSISAQYNIPTIGANNRTAAISASDYCAPYGGLNAMELASRENRELPNALASALLNMVPASYTHTASSESMTLLEVMNKDETGLPAQLSEPSSVNCAG